MEAQKLSPKEKPILLSLILTFIITGVSIVMFGRLEVLERRIYPWPAGGFQLLILAAIALVVTIFLATKLLGQKEGLRFLAREIGGGFILIIGAGVIVGFFLRAIFYGYIFITVVFILFAAAYYYIYYLYKKARTFQ
ncbi:hypothetical protein A2X44_04585 [candidate division CPR3 bacterium GWF2_35_18]|uniref:Uncharacterized protein n=1 Tax=candidate division CPR3 bacterium GW2011_GWF2_35_18 TaxID=1618350 RepID=A0A0G0E2H8_UNCC3|nr:MAG: hypothetical protein UR67_C0007G0105 [candidate division CPR3 bacterium GW2011_GWF2_35_18]OGB62629.1 MAG: hypothetical protein A2X44_04585 [candidate division CPR3 bacterium GWF2_35_18]OGB65879.1 MAG: hypothetical protein A2250_01835 [candidate division CPR3 bacterium RIFOXYA2_FULL_35_13]